VWAGAKWHWCAAAGETKFASQNVGDRLAHHCSLRGDEGVGIVVNVECLLWEGDAQFASEYCRRWFTGHVRFRYQEIEYVLVYGDLLHPDPPGSVRRHYGVDRE